MKLKYVFQIQSGLKKYKFIKTNLKAANILDGSYQSIYKGRSLNFEELREYVEGDELKDVDWSATARTRKLLVRQYIAEKKHNFLLVMDCNKRMLAHTDSGKQKSDVAIHAAGTLAYLVNLNGDYVGAMYTTPDGIENYHGRTGVYNIENILSHYDADVHKKNDTHLEPILRYVSGHVSKKTMIVMVTDLEEFTSIPENLLTMLLAQHELMLILVSDADVLGKHVYNTETDQYLPAFFSQSRMLRKQELARKKKIIESAERIIERHGIAHIFVNDTENIDTEIIKLLEKKKAIKF